MARDFGFVDGECCKGFDEACNFVSAGDFSFAFVRARHGRLVCERVSGEVQVKQRWYVVGRWFRGGNGGCSGGADLCIHGPPGAQVIWASWFVGLRCVEDRSERVKGFRGLL